VGYNRAARMIEQMEQEGVVGPQEGTRAREIFVRPFDVE
jgi:S-DNA-T family DNA segregation ATPase FtsK/SpoIIIE